MENIREQINQYSDFFKIAGVDEKDYTVPENGTWSEKAALQLKRLKVSQKVLNQGKKVVRADTSQRKYFPWFWVKPDAVALAGFRLSCNVCGYAYGHATLGARPEYLNSDDAVFMGTTFTSEFELLAQYQAMADEEE
jgi:hypothetical protein